MYYQPIHFILSMLFATENPNKYIMINDITQR